MVTCSLSLSYNYHHQEGNKAASTCFLRDTWSHVNPASGIFSNTYIVFCIHELADSHNWLQFPNCEFVVMGRTLFCCTTYESGQSFLWVTFLGYSTGYSIIDMCAAQLVLLFNEKIYKKLERERNESQVTCVWCNNKLAEVKEHCCTVIWQFIIVT